MEADKIKDLYNSPATNNLGRQLVRESREACKELIDAMQPGETYKLWLAYTLDQAIVRTGIFTRSEMLQIVMDEGTWIFKCDIFYIQKQ